FGDKRLDKRASQLSSLLYFGKSSSIHRIAKTEAEQKAAYRFLSNEKVEEDILIEACKERSSYLCEDKDVIVLLDTTEFNVDNHRNRIKADSGLGVTGNNKDLGFFLHGSLVIDAATEAALGFSDIQLMHREEDREQKDYPKLPIEEKESYKWIKACIESKQHLSKAASVTFIEDREGDIYEQFAAVPDERTHLIIRSRSDRRLYGGTKLYEQLACQPAAGSYSIKLVKDIRKGIESRKAHVEVRFCKVSIAKPALIKKEGIAKKIELYAVEVREVNGPKEDAVLWRILTTHEVNSYEDAISIVNKYRQRWHIEQLFRLLKKKGFKIESSELETGWAIRKLTVMILNTALRVMQMMLAYNNEESQPIEQVFNEDEVKCLEQINNTLQGETEKTKNKNNPKRLSWASWIIARLGGWKNYNSKRPPGPIILKRGLTSLMQCSKDGNWPNLFKYLCPNGSPKRRREIESKTAANAAVLLMDNHIQIN
ncbi:MAG: Transposase for transposon Tn5, partial [Segetibacter sp.]|nr:Transposase for transposon Tn5 [Segetibacter sp.]